MEASKPLILSTISRIEDYLKTCNVWKVVFVSVGSTTALSYVFRQLNYKIPLTHRLKTSFFNTIRQFPFVRRKIEDEIAKMEKNFSEEFLKPFSESVEYVNLPGIGMSQEEIIETTKKFLEDSGEFDWKNGMLSGTVYNGDDELTRLMTHIYGLSVWSNPLHPDVFPGIRKMEAEIVRMVCNLFKGSENSVGCVTSGGTESIILACKAYRDWGRAVKGITDPVLVVPRTAHAAFDKAASLLDMGIVHVDVDPITCKVNIQAMKKAINSRTCCLVGSAPQFPHGSIDDIESIAQLGLKYNVPVHVDACLGGFLIAFMAEAGYPLDSPFDFSIPGVTSISVDTHKYGFAPKGTSVLCYSEPIYRHYQWFTTPNWPGGIYATSTISGSRSGALIAATWAALLYYGKSGYVKTTKKIIETTRIITKELKGIQGIQILGSPEVSVIALTSEAFNIYGLSDGMRQRGWNLNALQYPQCIHICLTYLHTHSGRAEKFINDIREITKELNQDPKSASSGSAAFYGMAQSIPDRSIIDRLTWVYLDSLYVTKNKN